MHGNKSLPATHLACIADGIEPRLVTSVKQCRDPCSGPPTTQQIIGSAFRISFHPDWPIDSVFFNRPIIAHTQILVHRWRPRTRISVLFHKRINQSLVSSVAQTTAQPNWGPLYV